MRKESGKERKKQEFFDFTLENEISLAFGIFKGQIKKDKSIALSLLPEHHLPVKVNLEIS